MSNAEIGAVALTFAILLLSVHGLGYVFQKLRQPRLIGEILAGVLLGPSVLGKLAPGTFGWLYGFAAGADTKISVVLNFLYWIGLFLLMFASGTETRRLMHPEDRGKTFWLLGVGTSLPFFAVLLLSPLLPIGEIVGKPGQETAALIVLAIAAAVMSIPVIARIFFDLGISKTRFASLLLGVAVLEDIVLWGALAVATSLAKGSLAGGGPWRGMAAHVGVTFLYMGAGLTVAPRVIQWLHDRRINILLKASPIGYLFFLLFLYAAVAAMLDVNLVFAAFLAGFGVVGGMGGSSHARFTKHLEPLARVSTGFFVPIYFAMVGFKLVWGSTFSIPLFLLFLFGSSVLSSGAFALAAWIAGFRGLEIVNLAVTKNARGGPGIVLASVAFEAGIINAAFYSTLVLTALLTSQLAGAWLAYVLRRGWPLLEADRVPAPIEKEARSHA